jgi:hypothetical protein
MNHVKTQLPYAILAGCVGVLVGDLPTGESGHLAPSLVSSFLFMCTGYEAYPEAVGIVLGIFVTLSITYLLAVKTESTDTDRVSHQDHMAF